MLHVGALEKFGEGGQRAEGAERALRTAMRAQMAPHAAARGAPAGGYGPPAGKRGLITGIANDQSIAWGCAKAMHELGAELAVTYATAKAQSYVRPLAEQLGCPIFMQCDVQQPGQLEAVFREIGARWVSVWQWMFHVTRPFAWPNSLSR